ncbi:MAG: glycosyltransferase family 61 protein [Rhodanobacteraceae bacterium]|nr:glycosyltransferase family 61 protein [Rhodanobacteraceae bacterium]
MGATIGMENPAPSCVSVGCSHLRFSNTKPHVLRRVVFWPATGLVALNRFSFVSESLLLPGGLRAVATVGGLERRNKVVEGERVSVAIGAGSDLISNHYHFLIDALPRLWHLAHMDLSDPPARLYLTSKHEKYEAVVRRLLPDGIDVRVVQPDTCVQSDRHLLLPQMSGSECGWLPERAIEFVRSRLLGDHAAPTQRVIYVSRRIARVRRILNEDELIFALEKIGVTCVIAETMTVDDQIELFAGARGIIGMHGAGLTNMLFARNARVLEIFSGTPRGHYACLARACKHDYSYIAGVGRSKNEDRRLSRSELEEVARFASRCFDSRIRES